MKTAVIISLASMVAAQAVTFDAATGSLGCPCDGTGKSYCPFPSQQTIVSCNAGTGTPASCETQTAGSVCVESAPGAGDAQCVLQSTPFSGPPKSVNSATMPPRTETCDTSAAGSSSNGTATGQPPKSSNAATQPPPGYSNTTTTNGTSGGSSSGSSGSSGSNSGGSQTAAQPTNASGKMVASGSAAILAALFAAMML